MFPKILCAIFISHGLLAAQTTPTTEPPATTEPTVTGPIVDETVPPSAPAVVGETAIIGPIADGTVSPPPPEPPLPNFKIRSTTTKKIMRDEPSGVPGLAPLRKEVTATVHVVEDPHLPEPPPPPPPADMNDPAVLAWRAKVRALYQQREIVFLSATVYDHQRTLLRWYPNGRPDAEMTAWSNIDFNHLCGFSDYTYDDRRFSLIIGIGNVSSVVRERMAQRSGRAYHPPVPPELPTASPGFVVTKGDTSDAQAMDVITGLHELYKVEGARLKVAYEARVQAQVEREAYLRANPPQPKDITIHIWKRETPVRPGAPGANAPPGQGGNP